MDTTNLYPYCSIPGELATIDNIKNETCRTQTRAHRQTHKCVIRINYPIPLDSPAPARFLKTGYIKC